MNMYISTYSDMLRDFKGWTEWKRSIDEDPINDMQCTDSPSNKHLFSLFHVFLCRKNQ